MKVLRLTSLLILLMSAALPVFAQDSQRSVIPDTIYVGADGKFEAEPDTAVVQFNIGAQETELKDAYARAQRAAEQIRQALRSNGIDPKQAEISSFQVSPVYDWKNPKRKLIAYRVSSNITVKVKDFSKVGPLAEQFANMDVTENQSISYTLENTEGAKAKAVDDAFRKAKSNALVVAQAGGRQLGNLVYASVDTSEMPIIRPMAMRAMAGVAADKMAAPTEEFSAQKITVTAHVNALFGLK
jgi:uncharacterized protein YggE